MSWQTEIKREEGDAYGTCSETFFAWQIGVMDGAFICNSSGTGSVYHDACYVHAKQL